MPGGLQDYVWAKRGYATCYARKANFNVSDVLRDLTWLKTLNRSGCKTNCGNCALTVAYALSGKGVLEAPPMCIAGTTPDTLETIFGGKFDYPKNGLTGIDHAIASAGNGAAGIVAIGDDTSGHVFNIVNDNGSVRLLDGQAGRELNWQEVVQWIRQKNWTKFGLLMTN